MQIPAAPSIRAVFDEQASLIEELAARRREDIRRRAFEDMERDDARQEKVRQDERDRKGVGAQIAVRGLGQGDGGAYMAALPTLDARCPTSSMNHAVTRSLERATASRTGPRMTGRCSSAAA